MNRTYHRSFLNVQINIPCSSEQENREKKIKSQIKGIKRRVPNFEFESKMKIIFITIDNSSIFVFFLQYESV